VRKERGSVTVAVLGVAAVAIALTVGLAGIGQALAARAAATTAAEAAALAAAPVTFRPFGAEGGPWEEAARYARANGAELVECRCPPDPGYRPRTAVVRVRAVTKVLGVGRLTVEATAAAEFRPLALFH